MNLIRAWARLGAPSLLAAVTPLTEAPGRDTTVVAFENEPVFFTGEENRRSVDRDVTFPADGSFSRIEVRLGLGCPNGRCDAWDRLGHLALVLPNEAAAGGEIEVELARFVTPYGVGGTFSVDATDLRPLLRGTCKLRVFIDTWVGPGSPYGEGWLFSAAVVMTGGTPAREPLFALPILPPRDVPYGDPAQPTATSLPPLDVAVPPGASRYGLRTFVTGHGQGNAENCAEFCAKTHAFTVGTTREERRVWRDDCDRNPISGQRGTWRYPRAGWCPGAVVEPWTVVAPADTTLSSVTVRYDVEAHTNTCRPGAEREDGTCTGCTLGATCAYDGGRHTPPVHRISAVLVGYR